MNEPNSISTYYINDESDDEEPIILKTSVTKEMYKGNKLKSRIELNACREYPRSGGSNFKGERKAKPQSMSSLPEEENINSNKSKLKKHNIDLPSKHQEKKQNNFLHCINICSIIFIVSAVLGFYFLYQAPLPIDEVKKDLHANILGQEFAISSIVHDLEKLMKKPDKIMLTCVLGPTGVGKSYLVNILQEQIGPKSVQVFHSTNLPDLIDENYGLKNYLYIRSFYSNFFIIVLDDLKTEDLDRLTSLMEIIYTIKNLNVFVLTVFNVQTENCLKSLYNVSENLNLETKLMKNIKFTRLLEKHREYSGDYYTNKVVFNHLNESVAKVWLMKEIQKKKFALSEDVINKLLESQDIQCHGLKGVHSKLALNV